MCTMCGCRSCNSGQALPRVLLLLTTVPIPSSSAMLLSMTTRQPTSGAACRVMPLTNSKTHSIGSTQSGSCTLKGRRAAMFLVWPSTDLQPRDERRESPGSNRRYHHCHREPRCPSGRIGGLQSRHVGRQQAAGSVFAGAFESLGQEERGVARQPRRLAPFDPKRTRCLNGKR